MTMLTLLDLAVRLPAGVTHQVARAELGRVTHTVAGRDVSMLARSIIRAAKSKGYTITYHGAGQRLNFGGRTIEIFPVGEALLRVRVDDESALPDAGVTNWGISIGNLEIAIEDGIHITPRKQRHDRASHMWQSEWVLRGAGARSVCESIHASLTEAGLRSTGVWEPPAGGIERWHLEASSAVHLVKVYATPADGGVVLSITLVSDHQ